MHIQKNPLDPSKIKAKTILLDVFQGYPEKSNSVNPDQINDIRGMLKELEVNRNTATVLVAEGAERLTSAEPPKVEIGADVTTYRFVISGSVTIGGDFYGIGAHIVPPKELELVDYQTGPEQVCFVDVCPDLDIVVIGTEVLLKDGIVNTGNDQVLVIRNKSNITINDVPAGVQDEILTPVLILNDGVVAHISVAPNEIVGVLRIQRQPDTIIPDSEVLRP